MKKRVLIGYADYGTVYKEVANYLYEYFNEKDKYEVLVINILELSKTFKKFSFRLFDHANKHNFLLNIFYGLTNNRISSAGNERICIKTFDNNILRDIIKDFEPDIVISTHFYFSYLATFYRQIGLLKSKIMTILSDFSYHELWISNHKDVDYFIVQNDIIKNMLIKRGVLNKKVYSFGIPFYNSSFLEIEDKEYVLKKYNLSNDRPIYLFFAGQDVNSDYIFEYFKILVKKVLDVDFIFIAGKNKSLKVKCENFSLKNDIKNVIVLGYTKDIFNLLNISEIVITKADASTLNECIKMKKPSILLPSASAPLKYNAKFMVKKHYSSSVKGPLQLVKKVKLYLNYPFIVRAMKNRLEKVDNVDACKKIYELVDKALNKK